jgi:hypothetical protein
MRIEHARGQLEGLFGRQEVVVGMRRGDSRTVQAIRKAATAAGESH